ncbi:hypothetical protein TNCT_71501 [Trichonephila clavata]|uniref:Uncharacterized protein n=1 Tax=Trichonephila clavata TaxID=2740835 RepID=A0A8X6GC13_TRICU|nr:hypothetical protein TNCT_71501 [Trichonephila clavata]
MIIRFCPPENSPTPSPIQVTHKQKERSMTCCCFKTKETKEKQTLIPKLFLAPRASLPNGVSDVHFKVNLLPTELALIVSPGARISVELVSVFHNSPK